MKTIRNFCDLAEMAMSAPTPPLTIRGGWSAVRDVLDYRVKLASRTTQVEWDDATRTLRWAKSGNLVPVHVIEQDAMLPCWPEQRAAYERETAATLAQYRARQSKASPEEVAEMRAAFGPGTEVVDVLTGRRTQL